MANLKILDGDGSAKYVQKTGAGSDGDPFVDPAATNLVSLNSVVGATDDPTVTFADSEGTISGKLRGLVDVIGPLSKAEDAAHSSGDAGIMLLAVRRDTAAAGSGADGDYSTINVDATGRLHVAAGATENHVGQTGAPGDVVDVTLSLDTSAYASGDLLADTQSFTGVRVNGGRAVLQSLTVIDEDDQGVAFTVYFLSANNTLGSENSAPSISDANARDILGYVDVATSDYKDLGGVKIACLKGIGLCLEAAGGSTSLYLAVVNGTGTPTFTASGVRLKLGLLWD